MGPDRWRIMTQPSETPDSMVAQLLKLTDLAARVEQVAAECQEALTQVASLREEAKTLDGRADGIDSKLAEVAELLERMSAQIDSLNADGQDKAGKPPAGYQVNPAPPWWRPGDTRCADTTTRLTDWVSDIYRPVFGYL